MTDTDRIADIIARLEKIADTFEARCNRITEHLDDHSRRIVTLETIQAQTDKRPASLTAIGTVGAFLVAIAALIVNFVK